MTLKGLLILLILTKFLSSYIKGCPNFLEGYPTFVVVNNSKVVHPDFTTGSKGFPLTNLHTVLG